MAHSSGYIQRAACLQHKAAKVDMIAFVAIWIARSVREIAIVWRHQWETRFPARW